MKLKVVSIFAFSILLLVGCGGASAENEGDQTDPKWVVNQVFEAANSNDYSLLSSLCDPSGEGDRDTKRICAVGDESDKSKEEFNTYFKLGKVIGEPTISGDEAKVVIKFGPTGTKDETMNLVNRDGKWYLSSF